MADILAEIVAHKRTEVEFAKRAVSFDAIEEAAHHAPQPRNFHQAIAGKPKGRMGLIAEIKKASPSAGVIKSDFDPVAIAEGYESAGADALSVLTDVKFFQGSLDHLRQVKAAVKLPVLRKDFIIDEYQVYEARAAGADAILLIGECLTPARVKDLSVLATRLGLTVLLEVHDLQTLRNLRPLLDSPLASGTLLGINNRDLRTFKIDVAHTVRLAGEVGGSSVLVSESGIRGRADVTKLLAAGVRGILVGETLMRAGDVAGKVRELLGD